MRGVFTVCNTLTLHYFSHGTCISVFFKVVDKTLTPGPVHGLSLWTTNINLPYNRLRCWNLVIRVSKLSQPGSIDGHYTGKTDLKLDSLSFLTLIINFKQRSPFLGSPSGQSTGVVHGLGGQCFVQYK